MAKQPKIHKMKNPKVIQIEDDTRKTLHMMKEPGKTYDDIIRKLISYFKHKENGGQVR